jgi:hypothetical protein
MNYCRVLQKGSGVVFGRRVFHVDGRSPKTTPDPVRVAYPLNKSDNYFFADLKASCRVFARRRLLIVRSLRPDRNDAL